MYTVCILTSVHRALDTRIFHKQARTLARAGYKVILIAPHDKNEIIDDVAILALPMARNRFVRIIGTWHVFKLARQQKADVYHIHDPELLPCSWLLRKLTGRPVIYDVHENNAEAIRYKSWIPIFLRRPVAWITDAIERLIAKRLSAIITVTEPMKQRFSDCSICVSVHNFTTRDIAIMDENNGLIIDKDTDFSIICSGGPQLKRKNVFETVLDSLDLVLKQNCDINCVIIGDLDSFKFSEEGHNVLLNRLLDGGKLKIVKRMPYNKFLRYIKGAKIGWRPESASRQTKTLQTRILEYMACALPIIAADDDSLSADIIRESKCGILVDPFDARAHASAILRLLYHPDEARQMGENGRKAVLERYNWENEAKKMLDLYQMLCEKPGVI